MEQNPSVSVSLIHAVLKYAADLGIDPAGICQAVDLPMETIRDAERRFSARKFHQLWTEVVERTADPDFGLHFAERLQDRPAGDLLGVVMLNCPTVGAAMEKLSRYHGLVTDLVQVHIRHQGELTGYAGVLRIDDPHIDRQISEAVICRLFMTLKGLSEGRIPASQVHFRHPRPGRVGEHRRIFNCPIRFEQARDELLIRREDLETSILLAHPRVLSRLEAVAGELLDELNRPGSLSEQVSQSIGKTLLQGGKPGLQAVAAELAIGPRQLQNRLKAEGTTYQVLLDRVRKELALRYLREPGTSLSEIAFLLGYSDQSAFNHAFKRWTGLTPTHPPPRLKL
ncbi:MAG: AraC family transcriptional regulator [Anaerolineales bacterium]|nr:AraC family transcriptional regulator [Anaerolineales bacterium]